jgi:hypothetical protein
MSGRSSADEIGFESSIPKVFSDWSADGRFLVNIEAEDAATSPISLLLNWRPPAAVK